MWGGVERYLGNGLLENKEKVGWGGVGQGGAMGEEQKSMST